MTKCDNCRLRREIAKAFDIHWHGEDDCPYDVCPITTNADRIRSMTDEELAVLLSNTEANFPPNYPNGVSVKLCETSWLDWLKQEASE